jgi:ATP-binding cassette subfamily B (MDR/TAP) protein 1
MLSETADLSLNKGSSNTSAIEYPKSSTLTKIKTHDIINNTNDTSYQSTAATNE